MSIQPLLDYNDPEINARQSIAPNASCDVDGEYADVRNLMHLARNQATHIAALEAQLAEAKAENERLHAILVYEGLQASEYGDFPPATNVTDEMAEAASREYMRIFGKHLLIKHARLILTAAQEGKG